MHKITVYLSKTIRKILIDNYNTKFSVVVAVEQRIKASTLARIFSFLVKQLAPVWDAVKCLLESSAVKVEEEMLGTAAASSH